MKMEIILDHQTILENRESTIFFAVRLRASEFLPATAPVAYAIILDYAWRWEDVTGLAANFIRHLPSNALLTIVSVGEEEPIYSLGDVSDKQSLIAVTGQIEPSGKDRDLSAAFRMAARELQTVAAMERKILLLTESEDCDISMATRGDDDIPISKIIVPKEACDYEAIVAAELDGLLSAVAQNISLRLNPLEFCESIEPLGEHRLRQADGGDGWVEFGLGECLANEDRTVCFNLEVNPLPCIDGRPFASLENEPLVELELNYDECGPEGMRPISIRETIHVRPQGAIGGRSDFVNFERRTSAAP